MAEKNHKCPNCGAKIDKLDASCPYCGYINVEGAEKKYMDELEEAYASGDINKEQYEAALKEGEDIRKDYCTDIMKTERWCTNLRKFVEDRIAAGEPEFISREKKALQSKQN